MVKAFNKGNRCPICGKPDWCGSFIDRKGLTQIVEKRSEFSQGCKRLGDTLTGANGERYYFLGLSKGENALFYSQADWDAWQIIRQAEYEEWCRQKGKTPKKDRYAPSSMVANVAPIVPQKRREPQEVDHVDPLPNETLDKVYRSMASHLILEERHRAYLKKEGWTDEMIQFYNVKSFPEKDASRISFRARDSKNCWRKKLASLVMQDTGLTSLRGVPGAYQLKTGEWTWQGSSGLIFFLPDIHGRYYRGRIRMDYRDPSAPIQKDSEGEYFLENGTKVYISMKGLYTLTPEGREYRKAGGKYRNLSSFYEDENALKEGFIKNAYANGCRCGNALGFYVGRTDRNSLVYVTEGEKKAAFASFVMNEAVISVPGVDSWPLLFKADETGVSPVDFFKKRGTVAFVVAFDADKASNKTVLERQKQTAEALRKEGFLIGIAEWDISLGKGLDDLLANGCTPSYTVYSTEEE